MPTHTNAPRAGVQQRNFFRPSVRPARLPATPAHRCEPAMVVLDEAGVVRFCSPGVGQMLGTDAHQLVGMHVAAMLPDLPLDPGTPQGNIAYATLWGTEGTWQEFKGRTAAGQSLSLEISIHRLQLNGHSQFLLGLRYPAAHTSVHEQFERLKQSAAASSDAVMITDTAGRIEYVNAAFAAMTGYGREEAIGRPANIVKSGLHGANFYAGLWATVCAGKEFRGLFVNRKKNGEIFHEEKSIRPFMDHHGVATHFVATGRDVTEQIQALMHLEHRANHDSLTGLPNRQLFMDRLGQAVARATRHGTGFALLWIDLDGFKAVNDTYGHGAGDKLLRTAAERLRHCIREEDAVARIGGDEFALLLAEVTLREDAEKVLDKILRAFNHGLCFENQPIAIRASIGVSLCPHDGENGEQLLKHADMAMYAQKTAAGNGYRFYARERASPCGIFAQQQLLPLACPLEERGM